MPRVHPFVLLLILFITACVPPAGSAPPVTTTTPVERFQPRTAALELVSENDLTTGDEVSLDDRLFRVGPTGALIALGITREELAKAHQSEGIEPLSSDRVVYVLGEGHRRLKAVFAGSRIAFQGRLYDVRSSGIGRTVHDLGLVARPVRQTFVRDDRPIWRLTTEGSEGHQESIEGTPDHPFYVPHLDRYVELENLQTGWPLALADGRPASVGDVTNLAYRTTTYNLEVAEVFNYYIGAGEHWVLAHNANACASPQRVGRGGALRRAKRDLGIPRSQHPHSVSKVPLTNRAGKPVIGRNGRPLMSREYTYIRKDGSKVVIQDHSAGHRFGQGGVGDQGPHLNVRPPENTRTGQVPGTQAHYPFEK